MGPLFLNRTLLHELCSLAEPFRLKPQHVRIVFYREKLKNKYFACFARLLQSFSLRHDFIQCLCLRLQYLSLSAYPLSQSFPLRLPRKIKLCQFGIFVLPEFKRRIYP